ncbi:hypothetical protein [Polaromonas sp.]|uniref:hypothetical protein n=1 Tax=Polaromonas sp. TaxID=1869339 RepID=UPI002FCC9177
MKQISAIERLQSLPPIFRGADLTVRFQWTSKTASHYLYLWKRRRLVAEFGGHSDVFANLLVNRQPNWEKALLTAMPSAVVLGIEALRLAGWVTQLPSRPAVAVNARQSVFKTERFEITPRDPKWFDAIRAGIIGDRREGLPTLAPAWALADLLREFGWGTCGLWPDDIEGSGITPQDEDHWKAACRAFDQPETDLLSLVESPRSHGRGGL